MTKVISFASGKGGVGKTTLAANLGMIWAKQGKKTLVIDGDWALGKLSILFGARPKWTIEKVLSGEIQLTEAITEVKPNLAILASPTGVVGFEELPEAVRHQLFFELDGLNDLYDLILFDHSSGVHWGVLPFAAAAHQHLIVTTSEPTSYTDAYAIMKILSKRFGVRDFSVVATMSSDRAESERIMSRFVDITRAQLDVRVQLLDIFSWEPKVADSIRRQQPFVELFPLSEFTLRLEEVGRRLESSPCRTSNGLQFFYGDNINSIQVR